MSLAELPYEAWVVRRTSTNGLRVLLAASAHGPDDVIIPLPWPASDVRLLDEQPTRSAVWALWDAVLQHWPGFLMPPRRPRPPSPPRGDLSGEPGARLLTRAELSPDLARRIPESWSFAQAFLCWPPRHGLAAWLSRYNPFHLRSLAPVMLTVENPSGPFRERPSGMDIVVAASSPWVDVYVINTQEVESIPANTGDDCDDMIYVTVPGWAEPSDHVFWRRRWKDDAGAEILRFHAR